MIIIDNYWSLLWFFNAKMKTTNRLSSFFRVSFKFGLWTVGLGLPVCACELLEINDRKTHETGPTKTFLLPILGSRLIRYFFIQRMLRDMDYFDMIVLQVPFLSCEFSTMNHTPIPSTPTGPTPIIATNTQSFSAIHQTFKVKKPQSVSIILFRQKRYLHFIGNKVPQQIRLAKEPQFNKTLNKIRVASSSDTVSCSCKSSGTLFKVLLFRSSSAS